MQYAFFSIPTDGGMTIIDELNLFLRSHRVVSVQKELTQRDTAPCWRLCIEYIDGPLLSGRDAGRKGPRVDYKEILSDEDFAVFVKLRDARKEIAAAEGIPVYAVCTNDQLAEIARRKPESMTALREIEGLGEAKCGKYGNALLRVLKGPGSVSCDESED